MPYEDLLTQTGDIYRPSVDAPTGPEPVNTWSDTPTYSSVACRIDMAGVQELNKETGAVITKPMVFLPIDTDILEKDRFVCNSVTYDVEAVDPDVASAGHHVEAILKAVK